METPAQIPKLFPHELERFGFDRSDTPMWVYDTHTFAFLAVNDSAVRHYGYSREEFLAMTILDIRPAEDITPLLREVLRDGRRNSDRDLWRHRRKDGSLVEVEISTQAVIFSGQEAEVVAAEDVTERMAHSGQERGTIVSAASNTHPGRY